MRSHPWVTALLGSPDLFPRSLFLPCWGTAQPVVTGFSLPSRQFSSGVRKTAGTSQALFPMVTSAIETPGFGSVMPNPRQRQLRSHAFSSTIDRTVLSTYFLSRRTKQSSALAEQLSSLEIKHSRLLASISN